MGPVRAAPCIEVAATEEELAAPSLLLARDCALGRTRPSTDLPERVRRRAVTEPFYSARCLARISAAAVTSGSLR